MSGDRPTAVGPYALNRGSCGEWAVTPPDGMAGATIHDLIHTYLYHLAVTARLLDVAETDTPGARTQLRTMKREILADRFPCRKQL